MRALLSLSLATAAACGATAARTTWHVVDLSHALDGDIPLFPGGTAPSTKPVAVLEKDGYAMSTLTIGEHTGTHVDAPAHFVVGGIPVDKLPVAALAMQAAVIDVRARVIADPDYALGVGELQAWERRHGRLRPGFCVLVRTGWDERWPDEQLYRNADERQVMHFPGVSLAASRFLLSRGVGCLGIDTLSADPGMSKGFEEHKHFLAGGGFHLENLTRLSELPEAGATVVIGVLPLRDGSGAPARVLALVPR